MRDLQGQSMYGAGYLGSSGRWISAGPSVSMRWCGGWWSIVRHQTSSASCSLSRSSVSVRGRHHARPRAMAESSSVDEARCMGGPCRKTSQQRGQELWKTAVAALPNEYTLVNSIEANSRGVTGAERISIRYGHALEHRRHRGSSLWTASRAWRARGLVSCCGSL